MQKRLIAVALVITLSGCVTAALKRENAEISAGAKIIFDQCQNDVADSALDPLRGKIEISRVRWDSPPPDDITENDTFANAAELRPIAEWREDVGKCQKRERAFNIVPRHASAKQSAFLQQRRAFFTEAQDKTSELSLALFSQKLTYGEFAMKRYEINHDAEVAELAYRQSALITDRRLARQGQQAAVDRFATALAGWEVYMQAVNARQPLTVHVDGTITSP